MSGSSEHAQWVALRPHLTIAGWDTMRVENPALPGTPDVNWCGHADGLTREGWVELKHCNRWPPRGGPLQIPHFRPQQRVWLMKRWRAGGNAHMLLRVHTTWILLPGDWAAKMIGSVAREQIEQSATFMSDPLDPAKLRRALVWARER